MIPDYGYGAQAYWIRIRLCDLRLLYRHIHLGTIYHPIPYLSGGAVRWYTTVQVGVVSGRSHYFCAAFRLPQCMLPTDLIPVRHPRAWNPRAFFEREAYGILPVQAIDVGCRVTWLRVDSTLVSLHFG